MTFLALSLAYVKAKRKPRETADVFTVFFHMPQGPWLAYLLCIFQNLLTLVLYIISRDF